MATIIELPHGDPWVIAAGLIERGRMAAKGKDYESSYAAFAAALALAPESPYVLINYGAALSDAKRYADAMPFMQRGLETATTDEQRAISYNNLGHVAHVRRELDKAEELFLRALEYKSDYREAIINLGANMTLQGRWQEAYRVFTDASLLFPYDDEPAVNRAICKLTMGDWRLGLPGYERRQLVNDAIKFEVSTAAPRWGGEDLTGKRIAIWPDQGLGDCIYCHRLVAEVARSAAHVFFMTFVPLDGALPIPANVTMMREGDHVEGIHCQAPVMSLMHCLRVDPRNPPPRTGLITGRPPFASPKGEFNVGLCWSGNVNHKYDDLRSIPAAMLRDALPSNSTFHVLQKDVRPQDEESARRWQRHNIKSVADLAALVAQMDLVISVDTLTLHVAGELGIPTLGLIAFAPDFRWGLTGDSVPWYPSVKLIRCTQPTGGWPAALARLAADTRMPS